MMTNSGLDSTLACWTAIGAGFDLRPAHGPIDLERLLLDTARHSPDMSRLFIMAATWLHLYGDLIANHRLRRLIRNELEPQHTPALGLLLDIAQQNTHPKEFASVIRHLTPAVTPAPLFHASQKSKRLAALAERKACPTSKHWGRWCQPFTFKNDALRPTDWIMAHHPDLRLRADFRGDLRSSILAALQHDPGAGHSELELARRAGGSRTQVRSALRNLAMTGRITSRPAASANRHEIKLIAAA